MGKKVKVDVIEIKIPETLKNEFFNRIEKKYGDTTPNTVSNVILDIFEEWITQADLDTTIKQSLQSELDAHNTDEEDEDDVFCDPMVFPGNPGVLDPDQNIFSDVEWNGNHQLNIMRARAQACFILEPKDYLALGRRLMDNILRCVVIKTEAKTV